jgi:hypothetical protein
MPLGALSLSVNVMLGTLPWIAQPLLASSSPVMVAGARGKQSPSSLYY